MIHSFKDLLQKVILNAKWLTLMDQTFVTQLL